MKRLSLQWRITLMTAALIGVTCVLMNCLIGYSGKRYMDAIGSGISAYGEIESGTSNAFDPQSKQPDDELTISRAIWRSARSARTCCRSFSASAARSTA